MSQEKNTHIDNYNTVMRRILPVTKIENPTQLAKTIGISQATVNRKKNQNKFEVEWAFLLATQFDLTTEWILTGKERKLSNNYLLIVESWLKEMVSEDPRNKDWFEKELERTFPEFTKWMRSREAEKENRKVA